MLFDDKTCYKLASGELDALLAQGWRHFGPSFFRYSHNLHQGKLCQVLPLRIHLHEYAHTKHSRKILSRFQRAGFEVSFSPFCYTEELEELFLIHRERFKDNIPDSLRVFVGYADPVSPFVPTLCSVRDKGRLIAASILDEGVACSSSVYGMFDPEYGQYSLGKVTMLLEIDYSIARGYSYYYHGYAYDVPSHYDYKKRFPALYAYDWHGSWEHMVWNE